MDRDGVEDLAVGAPWDDEAGVTAQGAVYIVFMKKDGAGVKVVQKIGSKNGGLVGSLGHHLFGSSVAGVGDMDGNGVVDLAVGAPWDDAGGKKLGTVYIFLMNADGSVKGEQTFSKGALDTLADRDWLVGKSMTAAAGGDKRKKDGVTVITLALGVGGVRGGDSGGVYVIEVPAGFVPVCQQQDCSTNNNEMGYTCGCSTPGYEPNGDGSCGCSTPGYEVAGDGSCVCGSAGYMLSTTGSCECSTPHYRRDKDGSCVDVNECEPADQRCGPSKWCENTIGSYKCLPCPRGYKADETGTMCVGENTLPDACTSHRGKCGALKRCENTPDGTRHQCIACSTGYHADATGENCVDIDECEDWEATCGNYKLCQNTPGSYDCEWCGAGKILSKGGKICKWTPVGLGPLASEDDPEDEHNNSIFRSSEVITGASVAGGLLVLLAVAVVVSRVKEGRKASSFASLLHHHPPSGGGAGVSTENNNMRESLNQEEGMGGESVTINNSLTGSSSEWTAVNPSLAPV